MARVAVCDHPHAIEDAIVVRAGFAASGVLDTTRVTTHDVPLSKWPALKTCHGAAWWIMITRAAQWARHGLHDPPAARVDPGSVGGVGHRLLGHSHCVVAARRPVELEEWQRHRNMAVAAHEAVSEAVDQRAQACVVHSVGVSNAQQAVIGAYAQCLSACHPPARGAYHGHICAPVQGQ